MSDTDEIKPENAVTNPSEEHEAASQNEAEEKQPGFFRELFTIIALAFGIAFVLRTLLFQPFHIPSASMEPTLIKGDYFITSKYSVGYGRFSAEPFILPLNKGRILERSPKRGDVLVFKPVGQNNVFIKRLVGLPGDQVQMKEGRLYINNQPVEMTRIGDATQYESGEPSEVWQETFDNGHTHHILDAEKNNPADDTSIYTVPAGYYFMLGDNRDRSGDSRMAVPQGAGYVPADRIIGRAEFILVSAGKEFRFFNPLTWGHLNGGRFLKSLR